MHMLVYYFEIFSLSLPWTLFNYLAPVISVASLSITLSTYMVTIDSEAHAKDLEKPTLKLI
jgi:hypothetical protein